MGWVFLSYALIILLLIGLILWLYGIFRPQSQLLGPVFYRRDIKEPMVTLTFDDGPHEEVTSEVLDILSRHGARATFFVMGERARQHPRLLQRMIAEGHEIGNHTYSHNYFMSMPVYSSSYYRQEIGALDEVLSSIGLPPTRWVRFPMGFKNGRMLKTAHQLGKRVAAFSFRSYDSLVAAESLVKRTLRKVFPGAILTLHDGADKWRRNDHHRVLTALPTILEGLRERGYRVVTLGELFSGDLNL